MGPGAPDAERLRAFPHAYIDRLEPQSELLALAESSSPSAPYHSAAYRIHRMHLATLLTRLHPDADTDYLVDAMLAILSARLFRHQREALQFSIDRIKLGLDQLLAGLVPGDRDALRMPGSWDG